MAKSLPSLFCHVIFYFLPIIHYLLYFANFPINEQSERPGSRNLWTFNSLFLSMIIYDSRYESYNIYKKQANGHDDKTSETEAFESIRCCSLAAQWHSHLWLSEMPTTCFTHTNFDAIKMFQYFRHFHVTKL